MIKIAARFLIRFLTLPIACFLILTGLWLALSGVEGSLVTPVFAAAGDPPTPQPCQNAKEGKLTDNYITDDKGEAPFVFDASTNKTGGSETFTVQGQFRVDFSNLQALFGKNNSDYLEGQFQEKDHSQSNITGLNSQDFNKFQGPGQKAAPKNIVDDLRVGYVQYIYNKPTLPEASNKYTDIKNGGDSITIWQMINEQHFQYPPQPPKPGEDSTLWLQTWGKYWPKIPTSYNEFYNGYLDFRAAVGNISVRWAQGQLTNEDKQRLHDYSGTDIGDVSCLPQIREIRFVMPQFKRTLGISDQLNQIIVPCAAQSWRHAAVGQPDSKDECTKDTATSQNQTKNQGFLAGVYEACLKIIKGPQVFAEKVGKALKISLSNLNPVKPAYAEEKTITPCFVALPANAKSGIADFCAIDSISNGVPQILPGDSCTNKDSVHKLNKENPNVVCTFNFSYTTTIQIDPNNPVWNSCPQNTEVTCTTKIRVYPNFRIPFLAEIWNNTLYSDKQEGGVTSSQKTGRPGIFSNFMPQSVYQPLFGGELMTQDEYNALSKDCTLSQDINSSTCQQLFALYDLLFKTFPSITDGSCIDAANNPQKLTACFGPYYSKLPSKNLPGKVSTQNNGSVHGVATVLGDSTGDTKERFIGATDCSKFFTRDIALKPKALQEQLGITKQDCKSNQTAGTGGTGDNNGGNGGGLTYYIKYGDTSILPQDADFIKSVAENFPGSNIDQYDYVVQQSIARGISPAFAISIWWEEGGFGGTLSDGSRAKSEFGCFSGGDTSLNMSFTDSFNCFLNFTAAEHPYNATDPQGSFTDWAKYFCGPGAVPVCSNNPNFLNNLETVYESVAPGEIINI